MRGASSSLWGCHYTSHLFRTELVYSQLCCILSPEKGGGAVEERFAGEAGIGGDQAPDTHAAPSTGRWQNYYTDLQPEPELSSSNSPQHSTSSCPLRPPLKMPDLCIMYC